MRPQPRRSRNDVGFQRVTVVKTLGRELGLARVTRSGQSFVLNLALHQKRWALTRSARRQLVDRWMARFTPKLLSKLALDDTECATRNGHWPTLARFFGNHGMRLVSVKECTRLWPLEPRARPSLPYCAISICLPAVVIGSNRMLLNV